MITLDAQLPPSLATWIADNFGITCFSATYLGLREANDIQIFEFARQQNAIVITKNGDFVELLRRFKSPPKIIWLTCGNSSKTKLKIVLERHLKSALSLLVTTDLVEISGY